MKNLFLFTITPVQSFIAQARKTQDLLAGSRMLSDILKKAYFAFNDLPSAKVIFPASANKNDTLTNRFLGQIECEKAELNNIGKSIELSAKDNWIKQARKQVVDALEIQEALPLGFDEQIERMFDFFWVFVPIESNDYARAYKKIEPRLEAIKLQRIVRQYTYHGSGTIGELGRKCNVDGERNVKFYRSLENDLDEDKLLSKKLFVKQDEVLFIQNNVPKKYIAHGEGLSAVSMLKRSFLKEDKNHSFPSSTEIAIYNSLESIHKNEKAQAALNEYLSCFRCIEPRNKITQHLKIDFNKKTIADFRAKPEYDDEYIFEEKFKDISDLLALSKIKEAHRKFSTVLKQEDIKLQKDYALINFDGDSMGQWLSGEMLAPNTNLELFHAKLSAQMATFASEAPSFLSYPKGEAIYSGGDDFLGLVNLSYLEDVLTELTILFDQTINLPLQIYIKQDKKLSFSAGIVIVGYKAPLHMVLHYAREMLTSAKEQFSAEQTGEQEKNAIGIKVIEGGKHTDAIFRKKHWQLMFKLAGLFNSGLSHSYPVKLKEAIARIDGDAQNSTDFSYLVQVVNNEISRLFLRSINETEVSNDAARSAIEALQSFFVDAYTHHNKRQIKINDFLSFTKAAEQLSKLLKR